MDPDTPRQHNDKPINQQNAASKESRKADAAGTGSTKVAPSPNNSECSCYCRYEPTPRWLRIFEAIGIVSAIAYAGITGFMWRDSHKNFVIDERAWLSIENTFPVQPQVKEGLKIESIVIVKNTGKTPAKKINGE
jgi:hypothetical protein